jgi:hypothetical protein
MPWLLRSVLYKSGYVVPAYTRPGACLSSRSMIAFIPLAWKGPLRGELRTSGVTSLVAKPVPPLVTIRLTGSSQSAQRRTFFCIASTSSGTKLVSVTSHWLSPTVPKTSVKIGMHLSVEGSLNAVSETMRIAALSLVLPSLMVVNGRMEAAARWSSCCNRTELVHGPCLWTYSDVLSKPVNFYIIYPKTHT